MTAATLNTPRQNLVALLLAEAQQVEVFLRTLEEEQRLLQQADTEPLFAIAQSKTAIARKLKQFADARHTILTQAGLQDNQAGYETLLESPLPQIWHSFVAAAERARRLNEQNGALIIEHLAHTHQALAILTAHSDRPTTYGRDGASLMRPGMRHLGSA